MVQMFSPVEINPYGDDCKLRLSENKAYATALVTSSVSLLSGCAQAM